LPRLPLAAILHGQAIASTTIPPVIRLRQSLEAGLRNPLLAPLLLLFLGLILAFVVLHTVEHGIEGLVVSCAMVAVAALRLVVIAHRTSQIPSERLPLAHRSPPLCRLALLLTIGPPTSFLALPLRR
jgi:hypothetical protein